MMGLAHPRSISGALRAILPEGSVKNEGVFLFLVTGLALLIGIAMYLRYKQPDYDENQAG